MLRRVDTKVVARRSYEWGTINEVYASILCGFT